MLRGFDIEVITEHTLFFVSGLKDQRGNLRILATDEYINIGYCLLSFIMVMPSAHICVGGVKLENDLIMYLHVTETDSIYSSI